MGRMQKWFNKNKDFDKQTFQNKMETINEYKKENIPKLKAALPKELWDNWDTTFPTADQCPRVASGVLMTALRL